jgi:SAM-dependent methyltransferase
MNAKKVYDVYWAENGHVTKEWTPDFFDQTLGVIKGRGCVLDYGCGMGYSYQRLLRAEVTDYIGADVSSVALEDARRKGCKVLEIRENGTVELPDDSCDGAVCSEVFEHLYDPLASAIELNRILKPGGVLVATVPNFGYLPWRFMAFVRAELPSEPESKANRYKGVHIRYFNTFSLARMMRDAGFSQVKVTGWCGSSIWDVFWGAGPLGRVSKWANRFLPRFLHFPILGRYIPFIFSERLRVIAIK